MRLNPWLTAVATPAIAEAAGWVRGRLYPPERPLIDLAQAQPGYPPAPALVAHLARRLAEPAVHRYTDILGLAKLREALAADIAAAYGAPVAAGRVAITAGCNQAFCLAVMALAGPGDEVLLPLPWYFNHRMWLDMLGVTTVPLGFRPEAGGMPDIEPAASLIGPRTRAIVLVTPNNPTGVTYSPAALRAFYDLARRHGLALIIDETYRDFLETDGAPHDLLAEPDWAETLVHLYSFSKVFCITGHRVGAIAAGPELLAAVEKAMDCVAICAPRPGQEAALFGLQQLGAWRAGKRAMLIDRAAAFRKVMAAEPGGFRLVASGAYFAYLGHPFAGRHAAEVARDLAQRHGLLTLPGSMFGPDQERYLRVAFANVETTAIPAIAERLEAASL